MLKKVNGKQALEEMLKIRKAIYEQERKIEKSKIFGENVEISILPELSIDDSIAKLTDNLITEKEAKELNEIYKLQGTYTEEYRFKKGDTPDWIIDCIFEYLEERSSLNQTTKKLLGD